MLPFLWITSLLMINSNYGTIMGVNGQRAVTNLGSRLKNNFASNKHKKQTDYVAVTDTLVVDEEDAESEVMDRVDLAFDEIKMILETKKGNDDRLLLDGSIRGRAQPGRMLAIMGPSGSGKSTLIHALAGKIKDSPKLSLFGHRYINGEELSPDSAVPAAFIEQEVNFFPHMTVKETLDFRVELKLGEKLRKRERNKVVDDLMDTLGLSKSANTKVGNAKIRGLSGGERKRLSIACEMISSPSIIFLDEPTSGLDSYQAAQVVSTLRNLANKGNTVIAVIHQPSQQVFGMFDDLLLLSEGRQMFFGEVAAVRGHLEGLGYKAPAEMGTAEHVLECISRVNGGGKAEQDAIARIQRLAEECRALSQKIEILPKDCTAEEEGHHMKRYVDKSNRPKAGILRQFKLLLKRALQETFRGKAAIIIKVVQQVSIGVIYGGIYDLKNNQASIQDRFGLLSLIAIGATNMAVAGTIRAFPKEKAIVENEMAFNLYRTFPYFIAKALSEIPLIGIFSGMFGTIVYGMCGLRSGGFKNFLGLVTLHTIASEAVGLVIGAISPTSDVALALFPPILILNIIFDGKNISEENTPKLLRWIPKVGLIRWGFEALALNEFEGLEFETGGPRRGPIAKTGEEALARFGLEGRDIKDSVKALWAIVGASWTLSYLGLSLTRQKWLEMRPPEEAS